MVGRVRSDAQATLIGLLIVAVKVMGGLVALGLASMGLGRKLHRPLLIVGGLGSGLLIMYGGLLVAVGAATVTSVVSVAVTASSPQDGGDSP